MTEAWSAQRATDEDIFPEIVAGAWLVRRGPNLPQVPARVWRIDHEPGDPQNKLDRSPLSIPWMAEMAGAECDPYDVMRCREFIAISEAEYAYQAASCRWARDWDPSDPSLKPRRRADLAKLAPIGPEAP